VRLQELREKYRQRQQQSDADSPVSQRKATADESNASAALATAAALREKFGILKPATAPAEPPEQVPACLSFTKLTATGAG
jgi:hypothetical protein